MKQSLLYRTIFIVLIALLGLYIVIGPHHRPSLRDFTWNGIKQNLADNIHLGLDLKGGSHLVMQVKTDEYLKRLTENTAIGVQKAAKDNNLPVKSVNAVTGNGNYSVAVEVTDPSKISDVQKTLPSKVDLSEWSSSVSGNTVTWSLTAAAQRTLSDQAVDQALRIIESRINQLGVAEPTLQRHGAQNSHQILLQMPGIQDPERIKALIVGESRLELVHVVSPPSPSPVQKYATKEEALASIGGKETATRRVLPYSERDEPTASDDETNQTQDKSKKPQSWVVVEYPPVVDGSELRRADAVTDRTGGSNYQIQFSLKPSGAEKFGQWTGTHINEYMGVVLNDEVKSIAFIKSQITDSGEITGHFTKQSAEDLALTLRSGALPAPIQYLEERTVGPSLGADSIRSGVTASIVGLVFVMAFMLFYYRGSGINAIIALILNMILTVAALVIFKATLTLPGIAGLILTIGMAVDSNVLIFERIREEMHAGRNIPQAIDHGFGRAFITIIDTHVTTVISSLFLFVFGTGPIRGFAVTLVLGLLINLFSAVYVSRTIFMWLLNRRAQQGRRMETLSI
jgi:preprotein translocase subunit SecD